MAAIAHVGIGLAAKRVAPQVPVIVLVVGAYVIDIIWGVLYYAGVEQMPGPGVEAASPWSHSLFMSLIWSALAGLITWLITRNSRTSLIMGLVVFSHWIVDFISHPMTAVFPDDAGLPLLFRGSPVVGLGLWRTQLGVNIGEYGTLILGGVVYLLTLVRLRRERRAHAGA